MSKITLYDKNNQEIAPGCFFRIIRTKLLNMCSKEQPKDQNDGFIPIIANVETSLICSPSGKVYMITDIIDNTRTDLYSVYCVPLAQPDEKYFFSTSKREVSQDIVVVANFDGMEGVTEEDEKSKAKTFKAKWVPGPCIVSSND